MAPRKTIATTATNTADAPVTLRFDLVELETFLMVAESGSFSLAARRLHISQPSVTSRVQRLESLLKTKLLVRTTRHVELTSAGSRLRERAEAALRDLRTLLREFQSEADEARLRVSVASTPMISALMLPRLIHSFGQHYPDVSIQLQDLQYEEVVRKVEAREVDFAVVAFDHDSNKLAFEPLSQEDIQLIVPRSHPLASQQTASLAQLADIPLMIMSRYASIRDALTQELSRRAIPFTPTHEVVNLHTLLGMVDAGLGATLLPRSIAQRYVGSGNPCLDLSDFNLHRTFGILQAQDAALSPAATSFLSFLQTHFKAELSEQQ